MDGVLLVWNGIRIIILLARYDVERKWLQRQSTRPVVSYEDCIAVVTLQLLNQNRARRIPHLLQVTLEIITGRP